MICVGSLEPPGIRFVMKYFISFISAYVKYVSVVGQNYRPHLHDIVTAQKQGNSVKSSTYMKTVVFEVLKMVAIEDTIFWGWEVRLVFW